MDKGSSGLAEATRGFLAKDRKTIVRSVSEHIGSKTIQRELKGSQVTTKPIVGYWLLGTAGLVFGIVVLGGLTRLTESGLSIVEWKPITGVLPPLTKNQWEEDFEKYKQFPEYKLLNNQMTLPDFKYIYYMEWGHRIWGRVIGLAFLLPATYFGIRENDVNCVSICGHEYRYQCLKTYSLNVNIVLIIY
ncbi:13872_t:CDS:2 [Entrophospora sp. SA101]|nr:13872_t:CDS:2 [Entrophospora sp. SA101]